MTVKIVILNWNGKHFLEKFLSGVVAYSQLPGVQIIVADNASTDESLSFLETHFPEIGIVRLDANYGFADGYNRALQMAGGAEYYVLLNSDVEVTNDWLVPMLELMHRKTDIAACMPKIRSVNARNCFEYAGAAGGYIDKYGYAFCRGRLFDCLEEDVSQYDSEKEIFWATGACFMIKAKLFHEFGGFDGDFFAHMEEIDLCWRLKNAGYTIWYTPCSVVYHVGGGMLPQKSPLKTFLNYRNNLLMLHKNLPSLHYKRTLTIRMLLDFISAIHALLKGDLTTPMEILKAHNSFRKLRRKNIRCEAPPTYPSCVYLRSIVYQFFIKGKKTFLSIPQH